MLKKILNSTFRKKHVNVVQIQHSQQDVVFLWNLFLIDNNIITLLDSKVYSSLDELLKKISKLYPLLLIFTGKGTVNKQYTIEEGTVGLSKFSTENFYHYSFLNSESSFTSVIRKDFVDETIYYIQDRGCYIVDIVIGPFVIGVLKGFIDGNNDVYIETGIFSFKEKHLISYMPNTLDKTDSINIGEEQILPENALHYATVINYLYPIENITLIGLDLAQNKEDFHYKTLFKTVGGLFLVFFLILLLSSYLMLDFYNKKNIELEQKMFVLDKSYQQVVKLEKNIKNKETILLKSGAFIKNFYSYYLNEITKTIPEEVVLEELNFFPIIDELKADKLMSFKNNIIEITGYANSSVVFSEWLVLLKNKQWIEKVEIESYNNSKKDFFKLIIKIKK